MAHIPKTAGSSLSTDLGKHLSPRYNISLKQFDRELPHRQRFDAAVDTFLEKIATKRFPFASGHISGDQVARICAALPSARAFTMLRDPIARYVSGYRYQRSPMHPASEAFKLRYPDFETFAMKKVANNKICFHLVPTKIFRSRDPEACIRYISEHYTFLGFQEDFETSFAALGQLMGFEGRPSSRRRENTVTPETAVVVTPELRAVIEENNALDITVYSFFREKYDRISVSLQSYLRPQDSVPVKLLQVAS